MKHFFLNTTSVRSLAPAVVRADAPPANAEIVRLYEQLGEAFETFKASHNERLQEIEQFGAEMPETRAKIESIEASIDRLQAGIDEQTRQIAHLQVGGAAGGPDDRVETEQAVRLFLAARTGQPVNQVTDEDVERYRAYRGAFASFLRRSDAAMNDSIRNELSVGIDPDGGYWVPTEMSSDVRRRLFDTSDMRSVANVMTISTDSVEFPVDNVSGTSGGWVSEKETRTETNTPTIGTQRINVHEQYAEPHATQRLLDDAAVDVEGWLAGKIADILVRTENTAFVTGTGVGQPRGFLDYGSASVTTDDASRSWGVLQYVASGAAGAFPTLSGLTSDDPGALIDAISKLKPQYRGGAVWTMSRGVEATVRKLRDQDGRYLVGMGDIREGATGFTLFGFPIHTMEDMPAIAADSFSIALGNFGLGYQIVDRQGIRVLRDPLTSKPFVKFYTTKRVGGDVANFDAIKLVKFAAS